MKFTDALFYFCILSSAFAFAAFIVPIPSLRLAERIFCVGVGIFSCWWNVNNLSQLLFGKFFGRLFLFFKAIPRCWAESKETSK